MAEFSTEWTEMNGFSEIADFSILSIFKKLKEAQTYSIICEGFGITSIKKLNNQCLVELRGSYVNLDELTKKK